jgi:protein-tyrosine phosphatase
MNNILVVCIGNICRSPMAEALLKQALPGRTVRSAGLGALVGRPADPHSVELMAERNIDISAHIAQQIQPDMVRQANIVFVMDTEQKRYIESRHMGASGKVFRLAELTKKDIPDPYRHSLDHFRSALTLIDEGVQEWAKKIKKLI